MDRSKYIGSSDAAAILGVSPWKSALQLYHEKTGEYREVITHEKEKIFNRGKRLEPYVIDMLVDELRCDGHEVKIVDKNQRHLDEDLPYLSAEVDASLMIDGDLIGTEIKTVHPFAAKDWGEPGTDEIPVYYTAQVLHSQMVTNQDKTIVAALIGADDLRIHEVKRDNELIQVLRKKEIEFWGRVQNRNPPEPCCLADIKRIYGVDDGSVIDADDQLIDMCMTAKEMKEKIKIDQEILDGLIERIKLDMGNNSVLVHQGRKLVTWKTSKPTIKTNWKEAFNRLSFHIENMAIIKEITEQATTTKQGNRPFLLK